MTSPVERDAEPAERDAEPADAFPPTLREVLLRPRWLAMLALCLVVAGVFAWLGQWQLSRAVDFSPPPPGATEQVQPIGEVTEPGVYLPEPLVGQRVDVSGSWVPSDFLVVSSRFQNDVEGYWVTGQFRVQGDEAVSLAVAVGWAATRDEADAAASALADHYASASTDEPIVLTGRLVSDEGPALPPSGASPQEMTRMSPAVLLGRWTGSDGLSMYRPYLVADDVAGTAAVPMPLAEISSPAPDEGSNVNWLNIFYAAEWAVFAGFAFYLWYRLAKDAWEKELEDLEDDEGIAVG